MKKILPIVSVLILLAFWLYLGYYNGFLPGQVRAESQACVNPKPGMVGCNR